MRQDVSRKGTAEICLKHGRERVYCENESLRAKVEELKLELVNRGSDLLEMQKIAREYEAEVKELEKQLKASDMMARMKAQAKEIARLKKGVDQLIGFYRLEYKAANRGELPDLDFNLAEQAYQDALKGEGGE